MKPWLSSVGLSKLAEVETLVRVCPFRPWFALGLASRPASGDCTGFIKPATHAGVETAKCPESLRPLPVLPPAGRRIPPPERTLLLRHRSYGLMRQTHLALPSFSFSPRSGSLCRLLPAPAASGFFPTLSLKIFPEMLDPVPRRSHRLHLPVSSSVSSAFPTKRLGRLPASFREYDFSRGEVSRLQIFLYVQASQFARSPGRSYRSADRHWAARAFTSGHIVHRYLRTHRIC